MSAFRGGDSMLPRILEAVDRYVDGELNLTDFETWFVPAAWEISAPVGRQDALHELAAEIFLRIAENDLGHLPEVEFRTALAEAANRARAAATA